MSAPPLVLVVDDEPDTREALQDVLKVAGYEVAVATNGQDALTYLEQHQAPAAILLDLFMPVMDGWEFAERLKSSPDLAAVPILVLTATGPHWGYPATRVFRKPIQMVHLLQALSEIVGKSPVPSTGHTPAV